MKARRPQRRLFPAASLRVLLCLCLALSTFLVMQPPAARAATYTYTNTVAYNIPDGSSSVQNGCSFWPATRYFLVDDYFTVNDLNVEFSQSHANRGQIRVTLTAPDGTSQQIAATSSDTYDNYYITLDGDSANALNDGNNDTIGGTRRTVGAAGLETFAGKNAHGHWTMTICDNTYTSGSPSQLFNEATLVFDGTAVAPPSSTHKQGPAVLETYFVPWPEDQVWTAMGQIFYSSCTNYNSFRDSYDAAPRQPMVSYTSIIIGYNNTVVTYDQWEDGYETVITFPSQSTTQVWGDGDLSNGMAPADPGGDDILAAGQVITLNDVMLSATLGAVMDFDGRDKVAASKPIGLTRSVWSDGSQTMFAAADEVYPVDRWGEQYYAPVGDDVLFNNIFEWSGASILAAYDGTLVDIDKDGNGVYETTGVALSQGQTYLIDDNTSGLKRGGGIRSNAGHPIQVNLMTADVCSGYESRTYPLMPYYQWSNSYFSPVSTVLTATTTASLYNPNAAAISVAYDYDSGSPTVVSIPAKSSVNVNMQTGTGAHFYSVIAGATNNVADNFGSQVYTRQDGSVNWATNWTETGDDGSATAGSISIGGSGSRFLRFYTHQALNVGDTIERQVADMTGYGTATLKFDYNNSGGEAGDVLGVLVSSNGGGTWTQIAAIAGNTSGAFSQDISGYIAANTRIRFQINARSGDSTSEYIYVDNVDVTFSVPNTPSTAVFYAIASVDTDADVGGTDGQSSYDWGITLVPESVMSQHFIVSWAPGDDPTFLGGATENTAPIWLTGGHPSGSSTPTAAYDICVDYNGDGGLTLDTNSGRYYDRKVTGITPQQQIKIYKNKVVPPDSGFGTAGDDQTGTQVWVCGPVDGGGLLASDAIITGAWGGDPLVSSPSKPGLDMGYTARNQRSWFATKGAVLQVDGRTSGVFDELDTMRYTVAVENTSGRAIPINTVNITDTMPLNATYVPGSTYLVDHNGSTSNIADVGGQSPLLPPGYTYTLGLPGGKMFRVYWDMIIDVGAHNPPGTVYNIAHVTDGATTVHPDVKVPVPVPTSIRLLNFAATLDFNRVTVAWATASEVDNAGFNLYRATSLSGARTRLNAALIPGRVPPGSPFGASYSYQDRIVKKAVTHYYWLEDVDTGGHATLHGPVTVVAVKAPGTRIMGEAPFTQ